MIMNIFKVEQQLAFTQHAGPVPPPLSAAPPPLPSGPPPPSPLGKKRGGGGSNREVGDGSEATLSTASTTVATVTTNSNGDIGGGGLALVSAAQLAPGLELDLVPTQDLNYIINTEQLINSGENINCFYSVLIYNNILTLQLKV